MALSKRVSTAQIPAFQQVPRTVLARKKRCLLDVIHPILVQMSEISHVNPNAQQMALKCLILQQLHLKNQREL